MPPRQPLAVRDARRRAAPRRRPSRSRRRPSRAARACCPPVIPAQKRRPATRTMRASSPRISCLPETPFGAASVTFHGGFTPASCQAFPCSRLVIGWPRALRPPYPTRVLTRALTRSAQGVWPLVQRLNKAIERPSAQPAWAPAPLLKRRERTFPQLGWPRETDSLCPRCVKEVRTDILGGKRDLRELVDGKPGEIKASIVEKETTASMRRDEEDVPEARRTSRTSCAIDPAFLRAHRAASIPGRDFLAPLTQAPRARHARASSTGAAAVLTVDLTNRCNMMCDPCFMDANQVGYVHELEWDEIAEDPRRRAHRQAAPPDERPVLRRRAHALARTSSDAIEYARDERLSSPCSARPTASASRRIPSFAHKAKEAGLRMAYLQFDGVDNESNAHRKIGNLFDVKLRAIENLHAAGIDVILVVTVVNGVNNDQVGQIVEFAIENADKITVVSFQPVSFTGRDEDITDEVRAAAALHAVSHLAHDIKEQTGITEPMRDWFPLSAMGPFSDLADMLLGRERRLGLDEVRLPPELRHRHRPLRQQEDEADGPAHRVPRPRAAARTTSRTSPTPRRARAITLAEVARRAAQELRRRASAAGYSFPTLMKQFLSQTGARGKKIGEHESDAHEFEWRILFVAGMWFQDLFNYDFRRTEMCIIPYGTQMGEISFCAYNTGVGWRQHRREDEGHRDVADWYKANGRHPVYAKGQDLPLPPSLGTVVMAESAQARRGRQAAREGARAPPGPRDVSPQPGALTGTRRRRRAAVARRRRRPRATVRSRRSAPPSISCACCGQPITVSSVARSAWRSELGVTGMQRVVIRLIGRFPSVTAGRLAELLHVHPSTLTGVLKRVVERGFVHRERDAHGRAHRAFHADGRGREDRRHPGRHHRSRSASCALTARARSDRDGPCRPLRACGRALSRRSLIADVALASLSSPITRSHRLDAHVTDIHVSRARLFATWRASNP